MNKYDTIIDMNKVAQPGRRFFWNRVPVWPWNTLPVYGFLGVKEVVSPDNKSGRWGILGKRKNEHFSDMKTLFYPDDFGGAKEREVDLDSGSYGRTTFDCLYLFNPVSSEQISYEALKVVPSWIPIFIKSSYQDEGIWCLCCFGSFVFSGPDKAPFSCVREMEELGYRAYFGPNAEPWGDEAETETVMDSPDRLLISWDTGNEE